MSCDYVEDFVDTYEENLFVVEFLGELRVNRVLLDPIEGWFEPCSSPCFHLSGNSFTGTHVQGGLYCGIAKHQVEGVGWYLSPDCLNLGSKLGIHGLGDGA